LLKLTDSGQREREGGKKWNWRFEWVTFGRGVLGISREMRTTTKNNNNNKEKKKETRTLTLREEVLGFQPATSFTGLDWGRRPEPYTVLSFFSFFE